jgi:protein TonB
VGDPGPPTISNAHWLQTPRNLSIYYPAMALRREIEGDVQLNCLVTLTGALQCSVASETPANWGFGAAAIRIAHDYRMVPAMRDGAPVEARYSMRVPFRLSR